MRMGMTPGLADNEIGERRHVDMLSCCCLTTSYVALGKRSRNLQSVKI